MPELLLCCALVCSHCRLSCALHCCLLLLQLCLLLKHLCSSAFSPFCTGFCHFRIFHTSLSASFHTSLSPFFCINSCAYWNYHLFLLPDEACGRNVFNSTVFCSSVCCFCQLYYIFRFQIFFYINSCAFPFYLWFLLPGEACGRNVFNSTVCGSSVCWSLNYHTSILFVLHKCRNFFSVGRYRASIVVFSARIGAAFGWFNSALCSTTYVLPLFHLSLLGSVTFVFFTLRCQLFFILRCHLLSS